VSSAEKTSKGLKSWLEMYSLSKFRRRHAIGLLLGLAFGIPDSRGARAEDSASLWQEAFQAFEDQDCQNYPEPGGILFLGSSTIRLWETTKAFPDLPIINRGFGGSQIADSVKFADRMAIHYAPRLIVFYAGDNDIAAGKSPERVLSDFQALVKKVHEPLPKTRIAFIAIKPSPARWKQYERQTQANALVEEFVKSDDRLTYIDVVKPMLGDEDQPRADLFQKDGLHLNAEGYRLWNGIVKPWLEKQ
jgi:GDSL-like Lipase/Acylhydrolase family